MRRLWLTFAQAVTVAVAALFVLQTLKPEWLPAQDKGTTVTTTTVSRQLANDGNPRNVTSFAEAARRSLPTVVHIFTSKEVKAQRHPFSGDPLFKRFFGDRRDKGPQRAAGLGSGVVVSDQGDILTSLHVVTAATSIQLTFADGTQSAGVVVAEQPENDIAVLRAEQPPAQLFPAILGNPNAMRVGDEAFAVGNPFGLYSSLSAGVISGFNRSFRPENSSQPIEGLIQIDAAVNPGNSGGPLLNRAGQVIGIVTALVNPTEQEVFIGIGFAVPITVAGGAAGLPPY